MVQEAPPTSLACLLQRLGLEKYLNNFEEAGVEDLETLNTLSDNDIRDTIGINLLGPRRKISTAIEKLRVTRYITESNNIYQTF